MPDLEKVIKGLDSCAKWMGENDGDACDKCPYHHSHFSYDDNNCMAALCNNALALLKEQFTEAFNTIRDAYNMPANREKILLNYLLRNACCCEKMPEMRGADD